MPAIACVKTVATQLAFPSAKEASPPVESAYLEDRFLGESRLKFDQTTNIFWLIMSHGNNPAGSPIDLAYLRCSIPTICPEMNDSTSSRSCWEKLA